MENLLNILSPDEITVLRLRALYEGRGYRKFRVSRFEEYRFYLENQSFLRTEQLITFNDLDGRLMALRPDVTLSIVKSVRPSDIRQKLYYIENVYRPDRTGRSFSEISQMGLECIGKVGRLETAEVTALAYESLKLTERPFRLALSHVGYTAGLMRSFRIPPQYRKEIETCIAAKNGQGLLQAAGRAGLSEQNAALLRDAAMLSGPASEVLPKAEAACRNAEMERAAAQLRQAIDGITDDSLLVDFSIQGDEDYYSGLLMCGYVEGAGRVVLSGGEYDNMMKKMGRPGGAIGFAVYLDELFGR